MSIGKSYFDNNKGKYSGAVYIKYASDANISQSTFNKNRGE